MRISKSQQSKEITVFDITSQKGDISMICFIKTDIKGSFRRHSIQGKQLSGDNIAPGSQARLRLRHAFRCPPWDSKRVGKFAVYAGAQREALDMYPRERRKPIDAEKSRTRFRKKCVPHMPQE